MTKFGVWIILFISVLASIMLPHASAIEVTDLYEYKVVVDDKSRSTLKEASKAALSGVLRKVSGSTIDQRHPKMREALANTSDYILKYEFIEGDELALKVIFQEAKLNALIKELDLNIWGSRRPLTLIWFAIEEGLHRELVTKDTYPQINQLINDNAKSLGIPVITPLLDLEDRAAINVADIWGNFITPIIDASSRYQVEKIISARLYKQPMSDVWQLDWQFAEHGDYMLHSITGDKQQLVTEMLLSLAGEYSSQFGISNQSSLVGDNVIIELKGITSIAALESARTKLQSIAMVNVIDVRMISENKVQLMLGLNGTVDSFKEALSFDTHFVSLFDPLSFEKQSGLVYQFNDTQP